MDQVHCRNHGKGKDLSQVECMGESHYRCRDCFDNILHCQSCIVAEHLSNPYHQIEVRALSFLYPILLTVSIKRWNGTFFERATLKNLGLRIQLGHPINQPCPLPAPSSGDDFVVIDSHGIHEVALDFCGCGTNGTMVEQLLRQRIYPATVSNPSTGATFRALEHFQLLSFESKKCSTYHYFRALARETDNTGTLQVKVL